MKNKKLSCIKMINNGNSFAQKHNYNFWKDKTIKKITFYINFRLKFANILTKSKKNNNINKHTKQEIKN
jgi:hypothetical protein